MDEPSIRDGEHHIVSLSCPSHGLIYGYPDARQFDPIDSSRAVPMADGIPKPVGGERMVCPFCGKPLEHRVVS